ncbi:glycosyltransferase family 92 protein [Nitzschia inconspicua]|uniref:Glycosyltransferase family 92 protein n=1 Tax=Nitzschia inconspicua TaxID=303405 RepID=A0A9K3L9B0_9STRA|nr:glycosyltransferase family 92 protein [Nitzschia inconspicua]
MKTIRRTTTSVFIIVILLLLVLYHQMNAHVQLQSSTANSWEYHSGQQYGFGIPERISSTKQPKSQQQQQQKSVNEHWTVFSSEHQVQWHNSSTDGRTIPGPYWEDRIYLMGARLTTSYEDDSVRVTLFGLPGNCRVSGMPELACTSSFGLVGENGTLWDYDELSNQQLFVRIGHSVVVGKENNHNDQHNNTTTVSSSSTVLFPMDFIPLLSVDSNANAVSLMWTANLTQLINLSKIDLKHRLDSSPLTALKLEFWIQPKTSFLQQTHRTVSANVTKLVQLEIPLLTGVVGHVGPQLGPFTSPSMRQKSSASNQHMAPVAPSALLQEKVDAVVCVAVFGQHVLKNIPEFVTHHVNVGFSHVIVGILDSELDGQNIRAAQDILVDFLEDGTISLAAANLPHMKCDEDISKLNFYSSCLHHVKGFAEYVAIFDIDEYWVPHRKAEGNVLDVQRLQPFPPSIVANDPLWKESPYHEYQSIVETMKVIHQFQIEAGCGEEWCFHTFVSLQVERKSNNVPWEQRTGRITDDFGLRGTGWDTPESKSIARTKYTNMIGFHQPGSCRYSAHQPYQADVGAYWIPIANVTLYKETGTCQNLFFPESDVFGCMHHFYSLNSDRSWDNTLLANATKDEYVHNFGKTVQQQLNSKKQLAKNRFHDSN